MTFCHIFCFCIHVQVTPFFPAHWQFEFQRYIQWNLFCCWIWFFWFFKVLFLVWFSVTYFHKGHGGPITKFIFNTNSPVCAQRLRLEKSKKEDGEESRWMWIRDLCMHTLITHHWPGALAAIWYIVSEDHDNTAFFDFSNVVVLRVML